MKTERLEQDACVEWETIERPGYLGSRRDVVAAEWDMTFGVGNWRIAWQTADGRVLRYEDIFQLYVEGYVKYFKNHPIEAIVATSFSYGYDEDRVSREDAFDKYALWNIHGKSNQFHHAAFNVALEKVLNMPFNGEDPVCVRTGKPGTPEDKRPAGWKWNPGRIPCTQPELIPSHVPVDRQWWENGSIEDLYQRSKVLQVKVG